MCVCALVVCLSCMCDAMHRCLEQIVEHSVERKSVANNFGNLLSRVGENAKHCFWDVSICWSSLFYIIRYLGVGLLIRQQEQFEDIVVSATLYRLRQFTDDLIS